MGSYLWRTFDGADFNGTTLETQLGTVTISASIGTPYSNELAAGGSILSVSQLVEDALNAQTTGTWTVTLVQVNRWRWAFRFTCNLNTVIRGGTFPWSILGMATPTVVDPFVILGSADTPYMPGGVWYWHQGRLFRRRPCYLTTVTRMRSNGNVSSRRALQHHKWWIRFSAARGAHIYRSDLAQVPGTVQSDPDDPNLPFEALWDHMTEAVYFTPDTGDGGTYYEIKADNEEFLSDLDSALDPVLTDQPLALADLTFTAMEKAP